jgi:hypothetical protein
MTKQLTLLCLGASLLAASGAWALDLSKVNPNQIVGGPVAPIYPKKEIKPQVPPRKSGTLLGRYRGSAQERALDAQIRAYRPSALKNTLVYGGYVRKWLSPQEFGRMIHDVSKPRDLRPEMIKLIKSGHVLIKTRSNGDRLILLRE